MTSEDIESLINVLRSIDLTLWIIACIQFARWMDDIINGGK